MLEPRKRTALYGKVWWCVFDTEKMEYNTILFGKYKLKRDCQYAIDRWNIRKEELKAITHKEEITVEVKYYELNCGIKAKENEEYGCGVCRGLVDAEYSIAIKADHYPDFEEAEEFIKEDLKRLGYDGVYGITPLTEEEVYSFFDTENIDNWKVLKR